MSVARLARSARAALALGAALAAAAAAASDTVYVDSMQSRPGDGSELYPHRDWSEVRLRTGQRYLLRRGGRYRAPLEVGGVRDVEVGAWGEGADPVIDGGGEADYGVRLLSTANVTVWGLEITRVRGACVLVVGSVDYLVRGNHCHEALFGVTVNAGRLGPRGTIAENVIHAVGGDGIGAWNLREGAVIRDNHVYDFGNDGIDILGSFGSVVSGNVIHDSTDHPEIPRGMGHSGIKAGGNRGAGGGDNLIERNVVFRVKNYGIWNRGAVGNIYRDNVCYANGVNFSFVNQDGPSLAVVERNLAREPSFAAGLRYSVAMPGPAGLRRAAGNRWEGGLVRVQGVGMFSDEDAYRDALRPHEQDTRF